MARWDDDTEISRLVLPAGRWCGRGIVGDLGGPGASAASGGADVSRGTEPASRHLAALASPAVAPRSELREIGCL